MSTFLELCQQTAEESGTIPSVGQPVTVTSQTGRLLRIVNWVNRSWQDIQVLHEDWRWLMTEFSGSTVASQRAYTSMEMGISSRFARWIHEDAEGDDTFSLYLPADGQSTERFLRFVDWPEFRRRYQIGSHATQTGKPQLVSVDDQRRLVLFPTPDAIYTIRGRYYKAPQVLAADSDEPEMPARFHEMIVWNALDRMSVFDEAVEQRPAWMRNYKRYLTALMIDQAPQITMPEPMV